MTLIAVSLWILSGILLVYVTWFFYQGLMNLSRQRKDGTLTKTNEILAMPWLAFGYLLDFLSNVLVFTVILLEFPREFLVTHRLSRHKALGGWRGKVSEWLCREMLDAGDPSGCHCR